MNKLHDENKALLDETEALLELRKSQKLTAEESERLEQNMKELERRFGSIDKQLDITSAGYEDLIELTKEYRIENDKIRANEAKLALQSFGLHMDTRTAKQEISDISSAIRLRNNTELQQDFAAFLQKAVTLDELTSSNVPDAEIQQVMYNMIAHGPWGTQETNSE